MNSSGRPIAFVYNDLIQLISPINVAYHAQTTTLTMPSTSAAIPSPRAVELTFLRITIPYAMEIASLQARVATAGTATPSLRLALYTEDQVTRMPLSLIGETTKTTIAAGFFGSSNGGLRCTFASPLRVTPQTGYLAMMLEHAYTGVGAETATQLNGMDLRYPPYGASTNTFDRPVRYTGAIANIDAAFPTSVAFGSLSGVTNGAAPGQQAYTSWLAACNRI